MLQFVAGANFKRELVAIVIHKKRIHFLEFQFRSVKCTAVTTLRKNFEQIFIPIQVIEGDHSELM